MKRKNVFYFLIAILILVPLTLFIIDVNYSPGKIELVNLEVEFDEDGHVDKKIWTLKWHGENGTELRLYEIVVMSAGSYGTLSWSEHAIRNQTVNDGEAFTVSRGYPTIRIEIYYYHREVIITESCQLTDQFVLFPEK